MDFSGLGLWGKHISGNRTNNCVGKIQSVVSLM